MIRFSINDAQRELDNRNGNFEIIEYNGMRNKSKLICKRCGSYIETSIDSLLRKDGKTYGCNVCNSTDVSKKISNNNLSVISRNGNQHTVRCNICNNIITRRTVILTNPKFICPYCDGNARYSKILAHPELYGHTTVENAMDNFTIQLLEDIDSLEWYYCLGLFMADGCFNSKCNRLRLRLSESDSEHIQKVANALGIKAIDSIDICGESIANAIRKYSINDQKTYNPCDISSITEDKLVAFSIGFIDGDGFIYQLKNSKARNKITIKVHNSWKSNLRYISTGLYDYFGVKNIPNPCNVNQNGNQYAQLTIGNQNVIKGLKLFIKNKQLPAMERKWNKVEVMI